MMKKTLSLLLCVVLLCSMAACATKDHDHNNMNENNNQIELPEGPYVINSADWPIYDSAESLTDVADLVFIGRITEIEFQVLDSATALPISESTSEYARALYTIYNVEVLTTYKGDTTNISKVRVMGGLVGYEVEKQLQVMEEGKTFARENGIPIWDSYQKVQGEVGESYLFVLKQFDTGYPTIINLEQAIYNLDDPTQKRTIGDNKTLYYSGEKDEYNNPLISVNDIISVFGKDALSSFTEKWTTGAYAAK